LSESRLESRSHSYDSLGPLERWSTGELEIPNLFCVLVIEYWNLKFVCNLVLGVWDFIDSTTPLLHAHSG
jgi:hypothetical protein